MTLGERTNMIGQARTTGRTGADREPLLRTSRLSWLPLGAVATMAEGRCCDPAQQACTSWCASDKSRFGLTAIVAT